MLYEVAPGSVINLSRVIRASICPGGGDIWLIKVWMQDNPYDDVVVARAKDKSEAEAALRQLVAKANAYEHMNVDIRPVGTVRITTDGLTMTDGRCYESCQLTSQTLP